jgi:tRNA (guanine37-N1)-methyltransferase
MLVALAELKNAQKVKNFIIKKDLANKSYVPLRVLNAMVFPITKKVKVPHAKIKNVKFEFQERNGRKNIEDLLAKKLTKKQLKIIPKSQEIIGDILILEIPEKLLKKEIAIAQAYLDLLPQIQTVVKKTRIHSGPYRTRSVKILAGKRTKETIHQESGVKVKLHLEKTYFSGRSGNERLRIAKQVKKGEDVLVMFSGAGPYPLVLSKNSKANKIFGIEMNPLAHKYAVDNLKLNKTKNVIVHRGDARLVLPELQGKFDRVIMPLPKTSEEFLDVVLPKVRKGGMVHLYSFLHEKEIISEAKKIKISCKQEGKDVRILRKVKCGNFSPGIFRVCFDIKVN